MRKFLRCSALLCVLASGCAEETAAAPSGAALTEQEGDEKLAALLTRQLAAKGKDLGFTEDDTWTMRDAPLLDSLGRVVVRFDRFHAGLRVRGGDVVVHAKQEAALPVEEIVSRLTRPIGISLTPRVDQTKAMNVAAGAHPQVPVEKYPELVVWAVDAHRAAPRLAWDVHVGSYHVLVSAEDGKVLDEYSTLHTAECGDGLVCSPATLTARPFYAPSVVSVPGARRVFSGSPPFTFYEYRMHDEARKIRVLESIYLRADGDATDWRAILGIDLTPGTTVRSLFTGSFGDGTLYDGRDAEFAGSRSTPAAELFANLDRTYRFYKDRYGRLGYNGRQSLCFRPPNILEPCLRGIGPVEATVHVPTENAAFDTVRGQMWFGYDRRADNERGSFTELDVVAHEFTHAVTHYTAGLIYNHSHSGALNESMSDAFGRAVTLSALGGYVDDPHAWWVGAGMTTPDVAFDEALRYMDEPTTDGVSLDHLADFPAEGIDPHYGSGIPNRAFALLAQWIGWDHAINIWYRALTTCFTESTTFADARVCTVNAASVLYPTTNPDNDTQAWVRFAWAVVGVY